MRTKIVATIGPASNSREKLHELAEAGVSVFRLNFSHGTAADFVNIIKNIREVEQSLGRPITIMQDLSGPKIRLGVVPEGTIEVEKGMRLLLGPSQSRVDEMAYLPFDHEEILESLEPGDRLVLADGGLQFIVQARRADDLVLLEADNSGIVTSRKGLALPGKATKVRALTDKDKKDLADGLKLGVDAVAISYVQTADDVREAKELIAAAGQNLPVVVKLERQSAVDNLAEILAETDVVMVARGDLGVECPLPLLPALQKRIISACNKASKPVIVATQMLLSMVNSPAPTRAETTDVANAVLDGADCVMLSEETAMGNFPVDTVRYMRRITDEAEKLLLLNHNLEEPDADKGIPEFLAYSACLLANKAGAKAIVSHSLSGSSARQVSARRPPQQIYALTPDPVTVKALNFVWGVKPVFIDRPQEEPSHLIRAEQFIHDSEDFVADDCAVITAGQVKGSSSTPRGTNLVKIYWK
ncbi:MULTISPECIES: pyruvate kinase [Desulfovibrio]|uniref:Pyruvate kinase n=2 Tax=Desulfovibrio TaxID=872 RepID=A0AA94HQY6_DESDE|nr:MULTISPECIES: pyruvate kinase [Desulfovibrio]ATD81097.1 pyruvate kinase [Desulfovibrio sp. G11]SFW24001.1 pyruvate kinase [Desulfovibrio desulfuricans]SPD36707.1 pyruvate kinase [Desulfovibrio sp. G11]